MATEEDIRRQTLWAWAERIMQTGCWEHDLSTGELIWSDNLFRIFGDEPGAIEPNLEYVLAATHSDDRARVEAAVAALGDSGETQVLEHRLTLPDGQTRYVRATLTVQERRDDGLHRLLGILQDITDSTRAEREIAAHVAVEEALADWQDLDDGAPRLMARLAAALDFDAGILWLPSGDVLVPGAFWHGTAVEPGIVESQARASRMHRGMGVPGRAWEIRQPLAHTPEDAASGDWADGPSGDRLTAAIAIPAIDGRHVLAVVELKRDREIVLGERLMRSLCGISHQLGHFLARRGGELAAPLLTSREVEVLQLAAEGLSAPLSAERLAVSVATIRSHLENTYRKLGAADRASAVATALRLGIID